VRTQLHRGSGGSRRAFSQRAPCSSFELAGISEIIGFTSQQMGFTSPTQPPSTPAEVLKKAAIVLYTSWSGRAIRDIQSPDADPIVSIAEVGGLSPHAVCSSIATPFGIPGNDNRFSDQHLSFQAKRHLMARR